MAKYRYKYNSYNGARVKLLSYLNYKQIIMKWILVSPTKRSLLIESLDHFVSACADDVQSILWWLPNHDNIVNMTTKELEQLADNIADNMNAEQSEKTQLTFSLACPAYLFDEALAA